MQHVQASVARACARTALYGALALYPLLGHAIETSTRSIGLDNFLFFCRIALLFIVALLLLYSLRHYWFTLTRMFRRQSPLHAGTETAAWPRVVVFVAAHNEEAVIGGCLDALLKCDYPADRLLLMPINDRSTDTTRAIIDRYVDRFPGRIRPFHRSAGRPGKAAALKDATDIVVESRFNDLRESTLFVKDDAGRDQEQSDGNELAKSEALREATAIVAGEHLAELIIVFDADYLPNRQLIKQLVSPFFDPEVGAVMGRVVPQNAGSNLLTRILDLERSAGYQVDQQARYSLGSVPQYGGTVGGVRLSALANSGGWRINMLAEDTDLTYRLLLNGWHTAYLNHAECYEEVPETWQVRARQIGRWAKGHNQVMAQNTGNVLTGRRLSWTERLDGLALLGVFLMSPILLIGWVLSAILMLGGRDFAGSMGWAFWLLLMLTCVTAVGNFAAFVQVAAAAHLDGHCERIRLLPVMFAGFLVSLIANSKAALDGIVLDRVFRRELKWDKTARFRSEAVQQKGAV